VYTSSIDQENVTSVALTINRRCRRALFPKISRKYGLTSVYADDRVCGVENATDSASAKKNKLCYSDPGQGVSESLSLTDRDRIGLPFSFLPPPQTAKLIC